jgi:hypothetical protein
MVRIEIELNNYLNKVKNKKQELPEACEICRRGDKLIWWSGYMRNLITFIKTFIDIPIRRVRCNACGHTFCVLPEFIVKFCRYGKDIIVYTIKELKRRVHYEEVVGKIILRCTEQINISVHTIILWKRKYLANLQLT